MGLLLAERADRTPRTRVPKMTQLSGLTVLIVDSPASSQACDLRTTLAGQGATVHVVSSTTAALMLAHRKRIDTAFVAYSQQESTQQLCEQLTALGIRQIFTGGCPISEPVIRPKRQAREFAAWL